VIRKLAAAAGLLALILPIAVLANQPPASLRDLAPPMISTAAGERFALLLLDPWLAPEFTIDLPDGYVDLDPDRDPLAGWTP
jgi:hypothetical protein